MITITGMSDHDQLDWLITINGIRIHRGIATKYLPSYLKWFHLAVLPKAPTTQTVLAATAASLPLFHYA